MRTVELFAGIGGFRISCDQVGINTIWANDINNKSATVYKSQFGDEVFNESDICVGLYVVSVY